MSNYLGARKFSKASYAENDQLGKQLLIAYLHSKNHTIKPETFNESYAVDIVSEHDNKTYKFEAEIKERYVFTSAKDYPFPTVSFLGRKEKWKDEKFVYCIICKETKAALFCESEIIFDEKYKESCNINVEHRSGRDVFYRVPVELCSFRTPKQFYKSNHKEVWDKIKYTYNIK